MTVLVAISCKVNNLPHQLDEAESFMQHSPKQAKEILAQAGKYRNGNRRERASWCLLNVWAKYNCYDREISPEQLDTACSFFIRRGSHLRKAQAYYLRGAVRQELKLGSEPEWLDDFDRGCHEVEKTEDMYLASMLFNRYGTEMNRRRWFDEAIPALEKSAFYAGKAGLHSFQVTSLINLSHAHLFKGDEEKNWDKSIEVAKKALEVAEESGSNDGISRVLSCLSACYSRSGDFDAALEYSKRAVKMQEKLVAEGVRKEMPRYTTLADAFRKVGQADSALFYASKCYDSPDATSRLTAFQVSYIIYRDLLQDNENTLKYMSLYQELRYKQIELQKNGQVVDNALKLEQEESRSKVSRLAFVIAGIVLLCIGLVFVIRHYFNLSSHKTVELAEAAKKVEKVSTELIDTDSLIASLRKAPHYLDDNDWNRVISLVDKAFDGWCTSLASSGLTPGNIRIACLVRLGFTTSESAVILGISPASVTKAKQRLKSRLS
ncbi:MAG: tetratricopeptide repeat protein [Candidatus Cryptobacteroides sp.]